MRRVEFKGWIIFDEKELNHGTDVVSQIEHELYNVDGMVEWSLQEVSNDKIEYIRDED